MTSCTILSFESEGYACDVEQMRGLLVQAKFNLVVSPDTADVIIFYTPIKGENVEFWAMLTELETKFPHKVKIITGCIPKGEPERIKKYALVGTRQIHKIVEAVEESLADNVVQLVSTKEMPPLNLPRVREFAYTQTIPIMRACLGVCQYCKSKRKGSPFTSYPIADIVLEVEKAVLLGAKEIVLSTPDAGAYGLDIKKNLPMLLREIVKLEGDFIVHLGMISPHFIINCKEDLIPVFKHDKIRKYLHFPIYSVSSSVLEDMGRPYNEEKFLEVITGFRDRFPTLTVETDVLVGHPLESEQDFWALQTALRKFNPDIINIIEYNPKLRVKKDAQEVVPFSEEEMGRRLKVISDMNNNISKLQNERWRDWQGPVLVCRNKEPGIVEARNFAYKPVIISSLLRIGTVVQVKIVRTTGTELVGEVVKEKKEAEVVEEYN